MPTLRKVLITGLHDLTPRLPVELHLMSFYVFSLHPSGLFVSTIS